MFVTGLVHRKASGGIVVGCLCTGEREDPCGERSSCYAVRPSGMNIGLQLPAEGAGAADGRLARAHRAAGSTRRAATGPITAISNT